MIRRNRAEEIVADLMILICQREWDANCARVLFRGWPAAAGHNAATATSRDATTNHGARTPTRRGGESVHAHRRTASPRRWVRTRDTGHGTCARTPFACFRFASAVNRAGLPPRNYSLAGPVATAALWISGCHRPTMRLSAQRRPTHRSDAVGPRALGPPESKVPPVQCAHRFFFF